MSDNSDLEEKYLRKLPPGAGKNDLLNPQDSQNDLADMEVDENTSDNNASLNFSTRTVVEVNTTENVRNELEEKSSGNHPRIPGNRRNRYKKCLLDGMSRDEAYAECMKGYVKKPQQELPANQATGGNGNKKRNRSDPSLSMEGDPKKSKPAVDAANGQPPVEKFRDVVAIRRIGIIPTDYPIRSLAREEMEEIRMCILELVTRQTGPTDIKPRFTQQPSFRCGWIVVYCANDDTAAWIKSQNCWQNFGCTAIDSIEFPKENVLVGRFKYCESFNNIFIRNLIAGQNDLNTDQWRVMNRNVEGNVVTLTFEVNEESLSALRRLKFTVCYGFGLDTKLKIVRTSKRGEPPNPNDGEEAEAIQSQSTKPTGNDEKPPVTSTPNLKQLTLSSAVAAAKATQSQSVDEAIRRRQSLFAPKAGSSTAQDSAVKPTAKSNSFKPTAPGKPNDSDSSSSRQTRSSGNQSAATKPATNKKPGGVGKKGRGSQQTHPNTNKNDRRH